MNAGHKPDGQFDHLLICEQLQLEQSGWESKFYQRIPKKITATSLFLSFWKMQHSGKNSLRKWCIELSKLTGELITKQSLNERLNEQAVKMAEQVLQHALNLKICKVKLKKEKRNLGTIPKLFNRILLRDSTTQNLPTGLSEAFPGNYSHGKPTAVMRIQSLFNFSEEKWEQFIVGSYRDNDQGAAPCIAEVLEPRDLILQDLGFFTLDWLEQLTENQFVITKWSPLVHLFTQSGKKLDLIALLKNKKEVDMAVLVGSQKRLPLRLVARKLTKSRAAKRIKSARNDRHARANHSKEYYQLLHYEIYLTNVAYEDLKGKAIAKLYGLRWHIEILFKSWKSYANFKVMLDKDRMHLHRAKFTVYAMLIEFVYLMSTVYRFIKKEISEITKKHISILKFMEEINDSISKILVLRSLKELMPEIQLYANLITYEQHSKRENTMQKYLYVNELCDKTF